MDVGRHLTFDGYVSRIEPFALHMQHVAIIRDDDRHNRNLCFDGQMKRSLFERQHFRFRRVASRPFGKDVHALSFSPHLLCCCIESSHGIVAVATVNEDSLGKSHYRTRISKSH